MTDGFPNDSDGDALRGVVSSGSDLSKPMFIDFQVAVPDEPAAVAAEFDAAGLKAAILDSQCNGQHYRDFSRRAMEAGVQGYMAFLRGQRVTYFGRGGEQHTEWFPGAGPGEAK